MLQQFANDVLRYLKTVELICRLAEAAEDWEESDIRSAIEQTSALPFSVGDVEYIRFLQMDEYAQAAKRSLDYLYKEMARISNIEERMSFFRQNIKPNYESANRYKAFIARQFPGRVFYKMEG